MSIQDRADEIAADFEFLDDWETRYAHIIDLGKANPHLEPEERNEDTKVRGCASQVWMVLDEAPDGTLTIRAESDAMIVSGLIALLTRLYSGAPRDEIQQGFVDRWTTLIRNENIFIFVSRDFVCRVHVQLTLDQS